MQLEELFARHHAELYRYAARFTGDPDLAEDVVQDAFVRLAERPPGHRTRFKRISRCPGGSWSFLERDSHTVAWPVEVKTIYRLIKLLAG